MTTALTLPEAAGLAYDNLTVWWHLNTLKVRTEVFCNTSLELFLESEENAHPVSNWLVLLSALSNRMPSGGVTLGELQQAAQYVYRVCWMAHYLRTKNLITLAQANGLLGNYNGNFG